MAKGFSISSEATNLKQLTDFSATDAAAMDAATKEAEERIHLHFETRQSTWDKLAPSTIAERIRLGYGPEPILVRSGHLRDNASVEGINIINNGAEGDVFTQDEIAVIQDASRSFYDMDDQDWDTILKAYGDAYVKNWSKTGQS